MHNDAAGCPSRESQLPSSEYQYGRLGGRLITALGIPSPKWKVYAIAGFDDDPETGESRAYMYPEVNAALQQMGWISGEASTEAPQSSELQSVAKQAVPTSDVGMLSINEVITTLKQRGFTKPAQSGLKVIRLDHPGLASPVYVKQSSSIHARLQAPLVLHPQYEADVRNLLSLPGIERGIRATTTTAICAAFLSGATEGKRHCLWCGCRVPQQRGLAGAGGPVTRRAADAGFEYGALR